MIDVGQFGIAAVKVVVDEDVVELAAVLDLALGVADAALDDVGGVLGAGDEAAAELFQARRQDEDPDGVLGAFFRDIAGTLPVNIEQDVAALGQGAIDGPARAAVTGAVDVGPFEEGVGVDQPLELGVIDEMIVAVGDLAGADAAGGHGDGQLEPAVIGHQAAAQAGLAGARGAGDDQQDAAAGMAFIQHSGPVRAAVRSRPSAPGRFR